MSKAIEDGRHWGRWVYRHTTLTLGLWYGDRLIYEVDLERCNDAAEILDWIVQVSHKSYIDSAEIGKLVVALDDLADGLQPNVCPSGRYVHFDFRKHLQSNWAAPNT